MVRKLIKHELHNTLRVAAIPALIMVLLAVLLRILIETSAPDLFAVVFLFFIFSLLATLFIGYFFGVYSFYQSFFTGTGYLTLSLPVTPDELIWSKLISAITVMFASFILCFVSVLIFFSGMPQSMLDMLYEQFAVLGELIRQVASNDPMYIVEIIVSLIISVPKTFLVFYAVMSVGQLFTVKNRTAISILLYVGLMFVWSIIDNTVLSGINERLSAISVHLSNWIQIVFDAAIAVGCYFLVRHIIRHQINLLA